jgi:tetratricopeptide (TPR) repeat protein
MGWKSKTYLIDIPKQLSVIDLPSWSPWEIGVHRCEDLMQWLGYSNAFCQFMGQGWAMAIIGGVFLFLASLQSQGKLIFHRAGVALLLFSTVAVLAAIVGWSLPFQAAREIRVAAELCSQQQYAESQKHLDRAVAWLPVLGQDTYYVAQRGVLDREQGIESDFATLQRAIALEKGARYDQAFSLIEPLLESEIAAVRREALRGIMRFAIQDYNCARFELSRERFELVLRHQPCNVKLIYLLQLQGIREARIDSVNLMRDRMIETSNRLNFGTKTILRAASQQNAAIASGLQGDPDTIWAALEKAKRP